MTLTAIRKQSVRLRRLVAWVGIFALAWVSVGGHYHLLGCRHATSAAASEHIIPASHSCNCCTHSQDINPVISPALESLASCADTHHAGHFCECKAQILSGQDHSTLNVSIPAFAALSHPPHQTPVQLAFLFATSHSRAPPLIPPEPPLYGCLPLRL